MNTGDVIQIEVPDFNPNIDEGLSTHIDKGLSTQEHQQAQGSAATIQQSIDTSDERKAPALSQRDIEEVDWPHAIPVEIPPQPDQDNEQNIPVLPTRCETNLIDLLKSDLEEEVEQFEDLQTYLTHHNTFQESQNICKEYRKRLLDLNNDRYYQQRDQAYETYGPTRDYTPVNQAPGPCRMTQELIQTFRRGRGQARKEELHAH